jgi:hypothetical protein
MSTQDRLFRWWKMSEGSRGQSCFHEGAGEQSARLQPSWRALAGVLAILAVLSALTASPAHTAPIQWTEGSGGNGHFYELITTPAFYSDAQATAIRWEATWPR